jgi:hypothetical protein
VEDPTIGQRKQSYNPSVCKENRFFFCSLNSEIKIKFQTVMSDEDGQYQQFDLPTSLALQDGDNIKQ